MRIQLTSDVHLEHLENWFPGARTISPAYGADVLVLAGDVGRGANALRLFRDWPVPVLYVAGNHEAYGSTWEATVAALRETAQNTSVRFLEREAVDFGGVRFLGCTLWTDYRLRSNRTQRQLMANAELRISDHRQIRTESGSYFSAADALREHETSRAWLAAELARPYDGITVVITHHGPHPLSVHPRYVGDPTNAAFVSNLTDLLQQGPSLWLHGHVHDSFDYTVGCCRVVANPRGYPRNASSCDLEKDLIFENPSYQCALVLEV
ncbi:metallophosphoesterase [Hydrogenophaga sp. SL48]|uniref:metallophosphoesterase n=1 Tax=Hydrogenophaga sp. SL48 TaxID=2806347 RepID=UPI0023517A3A|nr:metallophosphoesterase [Hydrogenophaga sp. SL48]UJW79421.1 metallophosphoesterase [Hydrogenophaga sp. SL48]